MEKSVSCDYSDIEIVPVELSPKMSNEQLFNNQVYNDISLSICSNTGDTSNESESVTNTNEHWVIDDEQTEEHVEEIRPKPFEESTTHDTESSKQNVLPGKKCSSSAGKHHESIREVCELKIKPTIAKREKSIDTSVHGPMLQNLMSVQLPDDPLNDVEIRSRSSITVKKATSSTASLRDSNIAKDAKPACSVGFSARSISSTKKQNLVGDNMSFVSFGGLTEFTNVAASSPCTSSFYKSHKKRFVQAPVSGSARGESSVNAPATDTFIGETCEAASIGYDPDSDRDDYELTGETVDSNSVHKYRLTAPLVPRSKPIKKTTISFAEDESSSSSLSKGVWVPKRKPTKFPYDIKAAIKAAQLFSQSPTDGSLHRNPGEDSSDTSVIDQMEDLCLLSELGNGGIHGRTYLVHHAPSDADRVLKVIECPDINYANKLFRQFVDLQSLDHKNIASPLDVFVSWDEVKAGSKVNVLYEYFENGSLEDLIQTQVKENQQTDINQVHQWMGQIVDALKFCHNLKIYHNNLKPSNIYVTSEGSLVLGDFGLPALVSDVATRTRTTDGHLYKYTELEYLYRIILEPESIHKYHPQSIRGNDEKDKCTDKTDVFSLGLVFYRIMFQTDLPLDYGKLMDSVDSGIDDEIMSSICKYLLKEKEQRPTVDQLAKIPEVNSLLDMEETNRVSRKRRISAKVPHKIVTMEESLENVMENLEQSYESENLVRATFRSIFSVSTKRMDMTSHQKQIVLKSATHHFEVQDIQEKFLAIVFNVMPFVDDESDDYCGVDFAKHILKLTERYPNEEAIIYAVLQVLFSIAAHRFGAHSHCQAGSMQVLLTLMQNFAQDQYVIKMSSWVVWSCAAYPENKKMILHRNVHVSFFKLMPTVKELDESLVEAFCACIWSLSSYREALEEFKKHSGVDFCLTLLRDLQQEPRVLRNVCMILANVVELDEICAYMVIASNTVEDALSYLLSIYIPNRDNPELVQAFVTLVSELSVYSEIRFELHTLKFQDILQEIEVFYSANREILVPAKKASANLRAYKLS